MNVESIRSEVTEKNGIQERCEGKQEEMRSLASTAAVSASPATRHTILAQIHHSLIASALNPRRNAAGRRRSPVPAHRAAQSLLNCLCRHCGPVGLPAHGLHPTHRHPLRRGFLHWATRRVALGITSGSWQHVRGVAQSGSAPGSGPGGRRFESSRPDHLYFASSMDYYMPLPALCRDLSPVGSNYKI